MILNKVPIICEVYGTSLERLRKLKHCKGNDLKALKDIANYLRNEEHWTFTDIADLLYRDRSTIRYYLRFDNVIPQRDNKPYPAANGALLPQAVND